MSIHAKGFHSGHNSLHWPKRHPTWTFEPKRITRTFFFGHTPPLDETPDVDDETLSIDPPEGAIMLIHDSGVVEAKDLEVGRVVRLT